MIKHPNRFQFTKIFTALLIAGFALPPQIFAADPPPEPAGAPEIQGRKSRFGIMQKVLSPEEMRQLAQAMREVREDADLATMREQLREDREEMRKAMREALLEADPDLEPILDKLKAARAKMGPIAAGFPSGKKGDLSDENRTKLDAAREAAKDDPEVVAAREELQNAETPGQKRQAASKLRSAMRKAMLEKDPSLEELMDRKSGSGKGKGRSGRKAPSPPEGGTSST